MSRVSTYLIEKDELMTKYEKEVRKWLKESGKGYISDLVPFFRDGVVYPEVWFQEGNDFRPLFILKEVSIGIDTPEELECYLNKWGNIKCFEFAEDPFNDIRHGRYSTWIKIAKLAKGLCDLHSGATNISYENYDLSYTPGEKYAGTIDGYLEDRYVRRTANKNYDDIINRIAVIDIKKVGGGTRVNSRMSLDTEYYLDHIASDKGHNLKELLCEQIKLIDPTIIICCGKEDGRYMGDLLQKMPEIKEVTDNSFWINEYHPSSRVSNSKFYDEVFNVYRNNISKNAK